MKTSNKFARIINVDGHQVLIQKLPFNDDEKRYEVKMTTRVNGDFMSATLGNKSKKRINEQFRTMGVEQARNLLNSAKELFEE